MSAVASIGTTHPWNIAGLGLDVLVAHEFGVRNLSVVAAVSAQDAGGMHAVAPVAPAMLAAQLAALPIAEVGAFCIGALVGAQAVRDIAKTLRAHPEIPAVVDPVFSASLGGTFADDATVKAFRDELARVPSAILTPNVREAAQILGREIPRDEIQTAARELQMQGPTAVLITGGDLAGNPVDAFAMQGTVEMYEDERIEGMMRGAGCVLAIALACELVRGLAARAAVQSARLYVRSRIAGDVSFGGLRVAF